MVLIPLKHIFSHDFLAASLLLASFTFRRDIRGGKEDQYDINEHKKVEEAFINLHLLKKVEIEANDQG